MSGEKIKELTNEIGNQLDMCIELLRGPNNMLPPGTFESRQEQAATDLGMSIMKFVRIVIETRATLDDSPEPAYDHDRLGLGIALQRLVVRKIA